MRNLGDIVSNVLRQTIGKKDKILAEIIINWSKIVGIELAELAYPIKIFTTTNNKHPVHILYIRANDSSVSVKLSYQQSLIIERIAIYFGFKAVHSIRIKVGN